MADQTGDCGLKLLAVVGTTLGLCAGSVSSVHAESVGNAESAKIEQLLKLLGDKDIRKWIEAQRPAAMPQKPTGEPSVP